MEGWGRPERDDAANVWQEDYAGKLIKIYRKARVHPSRFKQGKFREFLRTISGEHRIV